MIRICIDFYDKGTKMGVEDITIFIPENIVLSAAAEDEFTGDELAVATALGKQIDYINCRPFEITEQMKAYVIHHHPELKEKFDTYLYDFIGRHGLGPEYD